MSRDLKDLRVDFIAGTLARGGAERQLYYMVKVLSKAGAQLRVLSLNRGEPYEEDIKALGVPVIWVGRAHSKMARLYAIIRELKNDTPEIIHSTHFYTNLYAAIAARFIGAKEIGAIRNDLSYEIKNLSFFGRYSLRFPRFLIANSQKAVDEALGLGIRRESIRLLDNAVDTEVFKPAGDNSPDTQAIRLLFVGRLTEQKRPDIFIRILSEVRRVNPHVCGTVVGIGSLRESLKDLAEELRLGPEAIEFKEDLGDMPSAYRQADIVVLTSDFEGMPNIVLEAMASGLPVVATDAGALPDIISDGITGYIIASGSVEKFKQCVLSLAEDAQMRGRIGKAARAQAQEKFSLEMLLQNIRSLYAVVLDI